jgi:acyl-CoA synthetase (AMP-forming)/AMP-acid ligase II
MTPDTPTSLLDIALRRGQHDPSTPFLLTLEGSGPNAVTTFTYGDVVERAFLLAAALVDAGVASGDRVGCYLDNSPSWVVASLAVWLVGGCVAAAGTLMPPREAVGLFELADASVALAATAAGALAGEIAVLRIDAGGELVGRVPAAAGFGRGDGPVLPAADDLAVAIFTSGTTGRPKGITHTHFDMVAAGANVASAYARNSDYRPEPAPAHLPPGVVFNPFGHMAGYSRLAFRMWIGRSTVLVPRFTVDAARELLARFEMESLQLTPTMIHMLATTEGPLNLGAVKYVTSGTAPLPIATREKFEARFGVPVMQAYGMTEIGAVAQERYEDVIAGRRGPGSVGRLAAGVEVRLRHLDDDRPSGEGEILVRTPEATNEFIGGAPLPVDEDGWFTTGDVGRFSDGILCITGRVQEKIIVGGFNVYPAEVEDAARRSSLVHDVVVVGLPDERLGERPVAGIVWAGEQAEQALIEELRAGLAPYKVPRQLFAIDAVPLTARDKVDRPAALELAKRALVGTDSRSS